MATPALDPQQTPSPVKVFISYAHGDGALKDELLKHLSSLKRQGVISVWHDRQIPAGDDWSQNIDENLESAEVILLLVSSDFVASDYCYEIEMKRALERHKRGEVRVIPIFLRPFDWKGTPLGQLQGLPGNGEPVTSRHWSSPDEAFELIAKGIRAVIVHSVTSAAVETAAAVMHVQPHKATALRQLLPPPADFAGRIHELAALVDCVKRKGIASVGIYGMGGVGKTALALKVADQLEDKYPDGQIYLDLKGVEKAPLASREAMAHVIRSFDLAAKVPESEAEITALYRSVLHNKRALLLMDNAQDYEQVKPLSPPDGSLLIVTSRQHLPLPGVCDMTLDVLSPKEAHALLCRIAPRLKKERKEAIGDLARLCGFLPLPLETVAQSLRARTNISATDYAAKLKDARERLKLIPVDAPLDLSYRFLPVRLQRLFRTLAVLPGTFDAAAAAAIWEEESTVAQDALAELLLSSLIDFNGATRRYRLHDSVRLFVDGRLSAKERETAQQRHAGHYLNVLRAANDLYRKGSDSVLKGLALFDTEWGNIQAGQAWAAVHTDGNDRAAEWCSRFPLVGVDCLSLRQLPRERIGWLEAALQAAKRLKERRSEGAVLGNLGIAHDSLGEYRRAIEYHEGHLKITRETGDRVGEGQALGNLGLAYHSLGEYLRAIEYHKQNLEIAREIENRLSEAAALGNLGSAYYRLGEHQNAIGYYDQQLQITREIGDRLGEGNAVGGLGISHNSLGNHNRAVEYYGQQLKIAREIGDRLGEASALWNGSLTLAEMGDRGEAVARAEAALKIFEQIEDPDIFKVRAQILRWREEEEKAKGQAAE